MEAKKGERWRGETPETDAFYWSLPPAHNQKTFQKWRKFWKRNSNHVRYRNRHKQSQAKALVLSAILNTWLPRPNFTYSNNTLLKAGLCKSELRYLKHWYCVLCPGLVKPILRHIFDRSWYMKLFHTPRTSFLLTTRLSIPLCVSVHKSTTWNQNMYEKFQWLLLADRFGGIQLRSVTLGVIAFYPITATSRPWMCHTICWMVLCQAFLSLLPLTPPPSKISSPLAP